MNTEKEASELWCPMVRTAIPNWAAENRERECNDNPEFSRCIASKCAMWRWRDPVHFGASRKGYCGIAGKPEVV